MNSVLAKWIILLSEMMSIWAQKMQHSRKMSTLLAPHFAA